MKIFRKLYNKVLSFSESKHASWSLGALSFAESSFFPIPPDVMLIPLSLGNPKKGLKWFAPLTTIMSVLGGIAGYCLGIILASSIKDFLIDLHIISLSDWEKVIRMYTEYGVIAVGVAGFTPIPFKIFTIASGVFGLPIIPFIIISIISRGARFYLLSTLIYFFGEKIKIFIDKYFNYISLGVVALIVGLILLVTLL